MAAAPAAGVDGVTAHAGAPAIVVQDVRVAFGGVVALADVSLTVRAGEIRGLIGPNGAGKSTLVNVLAGLQRSHGGQVELFGRRCRSESPHRRARMGLGRTFQEPALFGSLTIGENVALARTRRRDAEGLDDEWLDGLVEAVGLTPWLDVVAASAPYPVRKLADMVRAVNLAPAALLVDEPAAGLPARERDLLVELLGGARERLGCAVVLIEHDVPLVFRLCDAVTVLSNGKVIADGTPDKVRADPQVIEAYLGTTA